MFTAPRESERVIPWGLELECISYGGTDTEGKDIFVAWWRINGETIEKAVPKRFWKLLIDELDIHKFVVAKEKSRKGYRHWQVRIQTSESKKEEVLKWAKYFGIHVEIANEKADWRYERKDGAYWTDEDSPEVLSCRYGKPNIKQKAVIRALERQNDREVMVWVDPKGNRGKTWLIRHLMETGKALYVPPTMSSIGDMLKAVASGHTGQPIVVIDIPRAWKWTEQLYTAIESIKDGMVVDPRYKYTIKDIWGVKVLVTCNVAPKYEKLSSDRWTDEEGNNPPWWGIKDLR